MVLKLSSPVTDIPRIGPAKSKYLSRLGITHARDFLYTFPRRYDDFSQITPIKNLKTGQKMTVHGRVKKVNAKWGYQGRRRIFRIFVDIEDDTGIINITWYNLRFLPRQLWLGRQLSIAGAVEENPLYNKELSLRDKTAKTSPPKVAKHRMRSPVIEFDQSNTHTGRIIPVYPESYGVTSRFLRYQVKNLIPLLQSIPEYLPADIRGRNKLIGIHQAVQEMHFPTSASRLEQAKKRLRFDELFFLQLAAQVRRQLRQQEYAIAVKRADSQIKKYIKKISFKLTSAQEIAIREIISDIGKNMPMNRLLQGDVGSGKSAVALIAARAVLDSGYKVLYLAPTEILARQQAQVLTSFMPAKQVGLLIGSSTRRERQQINKRLMDKKQFCLVGTHALIQEKIHVNNLALVIIDEQHRFGVEQRSALLRRSSSPAKKYTPHLLSMTATPIPRTLNLTVYGDLDISLLNEMPPGRTPVATTIISPTQHDTAITEVLEQLHRGRQAFVIAPLVEMSNSLAAKSAQEILVEMKHYFPDVAIELIHGKISSAEKAAIMNNFLAGAIQLLVSTSVVEVGVNVPNATRMIIEAPERFGLAQLHQLRGRIGREEHKSHCYLFPTTAADANNPRLQALVRTNDGFQIAEEDLRLRGPGEAYGTTQSGFGSLQVASLLDYDTIKLTRAEAKKLLEKDSQLKKYPILRKKVEQKNRVAHYE